MLDLADKEQLLSYLKSNGLYTKHSLGQNFLVDREALEKIIDAAELDKNDTVIEVGPGVGTLTVELAKLAGDLSAVELDNKLADLLISNSKFLISNQIPNPNFENLEIDNSLKNENCKLQIINSDILKLNLPEIVGDKPYKVVANIPYYITSKILEFFLTQANKPELIVMLTQKEVAERICAKPGALSILAISVQLYGEPEIVDIVKRNSFFPSPDVDSAVLRIRIRSRVAEWQSGREKSTPSLDEKQLFRLLHIGFASKRKTLVNNLSAGLHIAKTEAIDIIKSVGLGENVRAQELAIEEWVELLSKISSK